MQPSASCPGGARANRADRSAAISAACNRLTTTSAGEIAVLATIESAPTLTDQAPEYLLLIAKARSRAPLLQLVLAARSIFWCRSWPAAVDAVVSKNLDPIELSSFGDIEGLGYIAYRLGQCNCASEHVATSAALDAIQHHAAGATGQIDRPLAAALGTVTEPASGLDHGSEGGGFAAALAGVPAADFCPL